MSPSIKALAEALAKFQGDNPVVVEKGANPQLRSQYANLTDILIEVRPKLAVCGLSLTQFPGDARKDGDMLTICVTNTLMHTSGEFISQTSAWLVPEQIVGKASGHSVINATQRHGSALTYARRYSVLAILGLATGDDDDARSAGMVGREDDDMLRMTDASTWQELLKSDAWRAFPSPDHPGLCLGDLKRSEITPMIRANVTNGGSNVAITAASAALLQSSAKARGFTVNEALDAVKWNGPRSINDFNPEHIASAITAISSLPLSPAPSAE